MFVLMGFFPAFAAEKTSSADALFTEAVQAYKDGRYDEAVRLNEQVLSSGVKSQAVYFNLGNSYLRSRQAGKAVLNYLRAEALAPRDPDIRANLFFARDRVEGGQDVSRSMRSKGLPGTAVFSTGELNWITLGFFMLAGVFVLVGYYKGFKRGFVAATAAVFLVCGYLFMAGLIKVVDGSNAAVAVKSSEARFEPVDQATVYFKLPEGAEFRVLKVKDGWAKIERADGKTGWVPEDAVEKI
jgi:tetratricopeptide (TPR) repeat protein